MTKSKNKVSDTITVFCIACLGAGGRWSARFDGLRLPVWKTCKVCKGKK